MDPDFIRGENIIIKCKQFYNPVYPRLWGGDTAKCESEGCFTVTTYDNEKDPKPIEVSVPSALDATQYLPAPIDSDQMKIQPSNLEIGTGSAWTIFVKVPIPMFKGCFIKLTYPEDLKFQYNSIIAQGFFQPDGNTDRISIDRDDIKQWNRDERTLYFKGCNNDNGIGYAPYGRIIINSFFTPAQIKDSGEFKLAIYKDEDMKMEIAKQDEGGYLS